jgi:hypothetical protein
MNAFEWRRRRCCPLRRSPSSLTPHVSRATMSSGVMDVVSPLLGRSPRALKRFVNVYRLMKARLTHTSTAPSCTRTRPRLRIFEIVLCLLAVDAGLPGISRKVYAVIESFEGATIEALVSALDEAFAGSVSERPANDRGEWQTLRQWLLDRSSDVRSARGMTRSGRLNGSLVLHGSPSRSRCSKVAAKAADH